MRKLQGRISVGRYQNLDPNDRSIHVTVEDDNSGTMVIDLLMTPSDFAHALTGLSARPCDLTVYDTAADVWGKHPEVKTEVVPVPDHTRYKLKMDDGGKDRPRWNADLSAALQAYEVDGWIARRSDAENWHNREANSITDGRTYYRITFHRFVDHNPRKGKD